MGLWGIPILGGITVFELNAKPLINPVYTKFRTPSRKAPQNAGYTLSR